MTTDYHKFGYARVSTSDQDTAVQVARLLELGIPEAQIYRENISGRRTDRPELASLLSKLRPGDVVYCSRIDRLGRSTEHLLAIMREIQDKGAELVFFDQPGCDTATPQGRMFLQMLAVIAEFETALRAERQREGIKKAKQDIKDGKRASWGGKRCQFTPAELMAINARFDTVANKSALARELGITRRYLYTLIERYRAGTLTAGAE